MNLNRNGILTIVALSGMIGIWLFCGDPVKPNFENPPKIGSGKPIPAHFLLVSATSIARLR